MDASLETGMRILIGIALGTLLGFSRAQAFTNLGNGTLQSDGSAADTQAAINAASSGNTVLIPAGTFVWTSGVTLQNKSIKLRGAGAGGYFANSATSIAIGTGTKTFTTQSGLALTNGQNVTAFVTYAGAGHNISGTVSSYNGTTLVISVSSTTGTGTYGMWTFGTSAATTILNNSAVASILDLTPATSAIEVSGIRIQFGTNAGATADGIDVEYAANRYPVLIHDCSFSMGSNNSRCIEMRMNSGVIWNCSFDSQLDDSLNGLGPNGQGITFKCLYQTNSWFANSTMGITDNGGTNNIYVENCYFVGMSQASDFDDNSRVVIRYCTYDHSSMVSHGADTSPYGARHYEVYNNTFVWTDVGSSDFNLNGWIYLRGGTGIIADNLTPNMSGTMWGSKSTVNLQCQNIRRNSGPYPCYTIYPVPHQIGQSYSNGGRTTDPLWIWGNSGGGENKINTSEYNPDECGNGLSVTNWVVSGRDYIAGSAKSGYAKFSYPHPLRASGGPVNQPPVVMATATPTNGAPPLTVSFSSAGSSDPEGKTLTYSWTFGDGGSSTAPNPSHAYGAVGVFQAQLSVSDGTNTTQSSILTIIVSTNRPPVAVAAGSPTNGVAPLAVTFSSGGSSDPEGTALTYNWAFGDGATSTSANPSHIYQAAGTYTAQLTVSDGTNATSSSMLLITATNSTTGNYATSFPLTESPISEGARWLNGKTDGLDWANIRTTPGLAFGTETGSGGYDDSTAVLKGSWGPNQTGSGRVHVGVRAGGGTFKEVEIRLRSSISAHSCTGYEINFSLDAGAGAYTQIVRWNGPLGSFTILDSRGGSQYQINEGDEVKAVISGNTITSYIRGQQVLQVTDNTFTSGNPGMGFYLQGTGTNDFGFTSYSAADGSSRPAPPTNLRIVSGP
jgi:PKD repeat protein